MITTNMQAKRTIRMGLSPSHDHLSKGKLCLLPVLAALISYCAGCLACRLAGCLALVAAALDHALLH